MRVFFFLVLCLVVSDSVFGQTVATSCTTCITVVAPMESKRLESSPALADAQILPTSVSNGHQESSMQVPSLTFIDLSVRVDSTTKTTPQSTSQPTTAEKTGKDSLTPYRMTKSPSGAWLRSIACPGWGQLYNESPYKAAMFFGGACTVTGIILWNQSKYSNADGRYTAMSLDDPLRERTYREREFYRDQRDVAGLWLIGVYVLSAVDAYVGAHLFDFDVSDKGLSLQTLPTQGGTQVALSYRF